MGLTLNHTDVDLFPPTRGSPIFESVEEKNADGQSKAEPQATH